MSMLGVPSVAQPRNHFRSAAEVVAAEAAGVPLDFRFFWGHRRTAGGGIGPGCLSQWWTVEFTVEGRRYASAEHFMMERKARLFGDDEIAEEILVAPDPGRAKALGRRVRGYDDARWERHRHDIVVAGNTAKFGQHKGLGGYLLSTGTDILVEASPLDAIWGIGLAADDERARRPAQWPGLNLLGFALMEVRATLANPGPPALTEQPQR